MLLRFSVENYKSIAKKLMFSMLPTEESVADDRFTKLLNTNTGTIRVLKRGGLFGPNASGKTTVIEAVAFAKDFIIYPKLTDMPTGSVPFAGNKKGGKQTTDFQFVFNVGKNVFEYSFSLDSKRVVRERLRIVKASGICNLFERYTDSDDNTSISISNEFDSALEESEIEVVHLLSRTIAARQKNQLFIYRLYDNGINIAVNIFDFFRNIVVIFPNSKYEGLPFRLQKDVNLSKFMSEMLYNMDTGVSKVESTSKKINFMKYAKDNDISQDIIDKIHRNGSGMIVLNGSSFIFGEDEENDTFLIKLKFEHRLGKNNVMFDMEAESDGTQRLLDLLPMLYLANGRNDIIFFIDEIDRSLHTKLSTLLVEDFIKNSKNNYCQLVFTAHDVSLLNLNVFRQDELWFVEKSGLGETGIIPLSDFAISNDSNILISYLSGRFGAIPVIRGA